MKKNILTASFATIATLLFTVSCTEREQFEIIDRQDGTFTAVIEQVNTKTTLSDGYKVEWQNGDIISVNGQKYSAFPKNPASMAVFQAVDKEASAIDGKYTAIYPANLYNAQKDQLEFPDTIAYVKGQLNTPMYAESSNDELSFKNLCGVLHLSLSSDTAMVKTITVTAFESICGPFKASVQENGKLSVEFVGKGKSVTLDCGQGINLSAESNDFYIPLPEGTYSPGMSISVEGGDNTIFTQMTKKEVEIVRNSVYDFEWQVAYEPKLEAEYNNVYRQMALLVGSKQPGKEYNPYRVLFNMCGDDVCAADAYNNGYGFIAQLNDFTYTADNEVIYNCYTNLYRAIDVCNKFIGGYYNETEKKLDSMKIAGLDSVTVVKYVDEVRVLRAWLHFTLAEGWGNPPIVDTYPAPENPGNVEKTKIYRWIEDEIESVFKDGALEERKGQRDKDGVTKVTKGFAQALLGKVYLFDGNPAGAEKQLKPLIESGNYALVPGERFFDLFHIEGNGCEEKIFELDMSKVSEYPYAGTETKLWACNDKCFVTSPWKGGQASESAWGLGPNADYAHAFLANDGDSYRRKVVFLTSDEVFYDEGLTSYGIDYGGTLEEKQFSPLIGIKDEGLYGQSDVIPRKLIVNRTDAPSGSNMTRFTVMRLGEAYLLYAEACIMTGNNGEAKKYIQAIQQRACSKTISEDIDMEVLKAEKKYELWMEGCRWSDIVRWETDDEIFNLMKKANVVWTARDEYTLNNGEKPHKLRYDVTPRPVLNFNISKHKYFPYPAEVLKSNPNLVQNPGWNN